MSEKQRNTPRRLGFAGGVAHWWVVFALLIVCALMWAAPFGIQWLLVQQLQHALNREVTVQAVHLNPLSLSIDVDGLSVKNEQGTEFVGWKRLTVDVSAQSFTQRALVFDALTLQSPRVSVTHWGQGRFDFSDLLDNSKQKSGTSFPSFLLRNVSIDDGRVSLEDRPFHRTHTLNDVKLVLPLVSHLSDKNSSMLRPELSATFNGAPIHVAGTVELLADEPAGTLALTLEAFDVSRLQAYVPESLPLRLARGKFSTDLKLQFNKVAGRMALLLNGNSQLQDVVLTDVRDRLLLSFKSLALSLRSSDVLAGQVQLSKVTLQAPQAAVRINSDGLLNWAMVLPPVQSKSKSDASVFAGQISQFSLHGGAVDFVDAAVKPTVQTRITDMNAVIHNISTEKNTQADVVLNANLGTAAALAIQARLQPLAINSFVDAKLQAKQVDLTPFSGYAQKYLGYSLNKGKLAVDGNYHIKDKQLHADFHVLIDHLTLGEQVPSPYAIDAPVSLGVSLLKNSRGQIDIDLPVSGTVDAPEFSLGGLVAQTFGNVLVKVVTAPVRAIGSLFSGDDKED